MARVMVVDDSLFMRNHLSKLLARSGYETILAENGEKAVSTYHRARPDAVLMDITMPRKDGLQALTEIREFDARAVLTHYDADKSATSQRMTKRHLAQENRVPDSKLGT